MGSTYARAFFETGTDGHGWPDGPSGMGSQWAWATNGHGQPTGMGSSWAWATDGRGHGRARAVAWTRAEGGFFRVLMR